MSRYRLTSSSKPQGIRERRFWWSEMPTLIGPWMPPLSLCPLSSALRLPLTLLTCPLPFYPTPNTWFIGGVGLHTIWVNHSHPKHLNYHPCHMLWGDTWMIYVRSKWRAIHGKSEASVGCWVNAWRAFWSRIVDLGSVRKLDLLLYAFSLNFHFLIFILQFPSMIPFLTYSELLILISVIHLRHSRLRTARNQFIW